MKGLVFKGVKLQLFQVNDYNFSILKCRYKHLLKCFNEPFIKNSNNILTVMPLFSIVQNISYALVAFPII
jgi:hypothetical protein